MKETIKTIVCETPPLELSTATPASKLDEVFLIDPKTEIEIHPLAAIFPEMEGKDSEQLMPSIAAAGQQVPVIMYNGVLLDGRNRLNACRALGITVKAVEWQGTGTAEELIIALNLHRRHLTASQRAALAVKLLPALEQQAAERMEAGVSNPSEKVPQGRAVDLAGTQVGVSGKTVAKARKIAEASEETYQELLSGKLTLAQAAKEIKAADAPESPSELKRLSALEVIDRLVRLAPDELISDILAIAEETTKPVRKTIRGCFIFEAPGTAEAEDAAEAADANVDADTDADAETEAEDAAEDVDVETDVEAEGYTEADADAVI